MDPCRNVSLVIPRDVKAIDVVALEGLRLDTPTWRLVDTVVEDFIDVLLAGAGSILDASDSLVLVVGRLLRQLGRLPQKRRLVVVVSANRHDNVVSGCMPPGVPLGWRHCLRRLPYHGWRHRWVLVDRRLADRDLVDIGDA